ncbi:MAG TPA: FAD-linked oxidase C-terminal domain-containing protein [Rugosimonospora sp.]|nr:FAD-linked oxidase C-terminal domain-containing protein [Rugosimonospora sp.]
MITELSGVLGPDAVLSDPSALRAYDCDGLTSHRAMPAAVVLAADAGAVAAAVGACHRYGVPFVARGAGTGLSGGATPRADGVLIVTSRLRQRLDVDPENQRAVVAPGVINLSVSTAAAPYGLYYAPDPSSQSACTIGGNVAENSGGAHCLKYGFTVNHVLGLEVVLPDGRLEQLGGGAVEYPGYDLVGAFVGSEGTLGVATGATLRLLPRPEAVRTLLAGFHSIDAAGDAVSAIIGAGVLPAAIEMMDAIAIEAVEAAVAIRYPTGAAAVLIVEVDGPAAEVDAELAEVERLCRAAGTFELHVAANDEERQRIWKGRKGAFAAMGRISPDYYVQDGVIPRTSLPDVLRRIGELSAEYGLRVANVFHAGDGNLHPLVLFDAGVPGQAGQAEALAGEILRMCLAAGGSITGEHGVGLDKRGYLGEMFTTTDLSTMQLLRCAFDPAGIANPGKVFPTPRLCGEAPGPHRGAHPLTAAGAGEVF